MAQVVTERKQFNLKITFLPRNNCLHRTSETKTKIFDGNTLKRKYWFPKKLTLQKRQPTNLYFSLVSLEGRVCIIFGVWLFVFSAYLSCYLVNAKSSNFGKSFMLQVLDIFKYLFVVFSLVVLFFSISILFRLLIQNLVILINVFFFNSLYLQMFILNVWFYCFVED